MCPAIAKYEYIDIIHVLQRHRVALSLHKVAAVVLVMYGTDGMLSSRTRVYTSVHNGQHPIALCEMFLPVGVGCRQAGKQYDLALSD
jgi:hypothetical protein